MTVELGGAVHVFHVDGLEIAVAEDQLGAQPVRVVVEQLAGKGGHVAFFGVAVGIVADPAAERIIGALGPLADAVRGARNVVQAVEIPGKLQLGRVGKGP